MATDKQAQIIEKIISRFEQRWQNRAKAAVTLVYNRVKNGGNKGKAEDAIQYLQKNMPELFKLDGLKEALIEAAAYGHGVMPEILTEQDKKNIGKATQEPWSADGMRLSEKLHGTSAAMHKAIRDTVQAQINKNRTALQVARELYDGYASGKAVVRPQALPRYLDKILGLQGTREDNKDIRRALENISRLSLKGAPNQALKSSYNLLVKAVESGNDNALQRAIYTAVNEKARYIAERIARTEMARAYADGFFNKHQGDPDVIGYQLELGTRHPIYDICDVYADLDMFNLGKGVYPKDQLPMVPIHPHCLCTYHVLYKGQLDMSKQKEQGNKALKDYLKKLNNKQQRALLGVDGQRKFAMTGRIKLQDVRGWQELQAPQIRNVDIKAQPDEAKQTAEKITVTMDDLPAFFKVNAPTTLNAKKILEHLNGVKASDVNVVKLWSRFNELNDITVYNWKITHSQKGGQAGYGGLEIPKLTTTNKIGATGTIFHEVGHVIDNIIGSSKTYQTKGIKWGMTETQRWYSCQFTQLEQACSKLKLQFKQGNGYTVPDELLKPIKELEKKAKAETSRLKDELQNLNYLYRNKDISYQEYNKRWKEISLAIEETPRNIMGVWGNYTDIIDALTDGYARDKGLVMYGHGGRYYSNIRNGPIEIVANYNTIAINSPEVYAFMQKELPELVQALQEYEKSLLKELDYLVKNKGI